jgi:hypothetical protein
MRELAPDGRTDPSVRGIDSYWPAVGRSPWQAGERGAVWVVSDLALEEGILGILPENFATQK